LAILNLLDPTRIDHGVESIPDFVLSPLKLRSYMFGGFDAGGEWLISFGRHEGFAVCSSARAKPATKRASFLGSSVRPLALAAKTRMSCRAALG
jgi:hypothetical protein